MSKSVAFVAVAHAISRRQLGVTWQPKSPVSGGLILCLRFVLDWLCKKWPSMRLAVFVSTRREMKTSKRLRTGVIFSLRTDEVRVLRQ